MKKVALISLGCAKNLVDSEVMLGHLRNASYLFVKAPEEADIILINTCGFIQPAREEAEETIQNALSVKQNNKKVRVIVTGCYVERELSALKRNYPEVDDWVGVKDFDKVLSVVQNKSFHGSPRTFLYDHNSPRFISTSPVWAYVKISEGCSHRCSFCTIPLIKGAYRSREMGSIKKEIEILVSKGIRELNLVSQDTTFFGRDTGQKNGLTQLLRALLDIPDLQWIRLLYGYPEEISDELLELMKEKKICSYLDIPFQHSHPRIIRSMKRGMDSSRSLELLDKIRKVLPDVSVRTSLIVGYPLEEDKEFAHLLDFVEAARFDHLGVFTYWREKGTEAHSLDDPVPEEEKNRRWEDVMALQSKISHEINSKYLNMTLDVLLERPEPGRDDIWSGINRYQAPEVDGRVYIKNIADKKPMDDPLRKVEIFSNDIYDLQGVLKS